MTLPLYKELQEDSPVFDSNGNRGLWFERFADFFEPDFRIPKKKIIKGKEQNPSAAWLLKYFGNKKAGDKEFLERHAQSQMQLTKTLDGQSHVFKSSWHFVTGMGNPHPVENGLAWHPTLGVPYLTGAAVKGLVRAYIENYLDDEYPENPDKKKLLLKWFGSTDKDPRSKGYESQAGDLVFFDALPVEPVVLGVDVMTPHMGKWYADGKKRAGEADAVPADWHDPVPVSFLVAKDITLLFSFALREYPASEKPEEAEAIDLDEVADVLQCVLEHEGAGSKTATGYGAMFNIETLEAQKKEQQAKAALADAKFEEGVYLKENSRNKSLFIERSHRTLGTAAGKQVGVIREQLTAEERKQFEKKGAVKVNAYVRGNEIIKISSWTK